MSVPSERWEPTRDPVHRLLLQFDFQAAMTACHRWRPDLPDDDDPPADGRDCAPPPADPGVHPPDIFTAEWTAAQADQAVALFARYGQPAAAPHVRTAAGLMLDFSEAYRRQPCPCHVCPDCGGRPAPHDCDLHLSLLYAPTRQALLHHLALGGQTVPMAVRLRGGRLAQLLRAADLPPDPHAALRRAVGGVIAATPPPAGPVGWTPEALRTWVDKLAGPPGTTVQPSWTFYLRAPADPAAGASPAEAALLLAGERLATRTGYKPGRPERNGRRQADRRSSPTPRGSPFGNGDDRVE